MTDHEDAFLRAVLDAPGDDAPRLIYADWLTERGDPRGEFIRVQCVLARMECTFDGVWCERTYREGDCPEGPRCDALRCRERELLYAVASGCDVAQCRDIWSMDAAVLLAEPLPPSCFRRGFVERIACTAAVWLARADALLAAAPIREVQLTTWPDWYTDAGVVLLHDGVHPVLGGTSRRCDRMVFTSGAFVGRLNSHVIADVLAAEWPEIKFGLPPPRAGTTRAELAQIAAFSP